MTWLLSHMQNNFRQLAYYFIRLINVGWTKLDFLNVLNSSERKNKFLITHKKITSLNTLIFSFSQPLEIFLIHIVLYLFKTHMSQFSLPVNFFGTFRWTLFSFYFRYNKNTLNVLQATYRCLLTINLEMWGKYNPERNDEV